MHESKSKDNESFFTCDGKTQEDQQKVMVGNVSAKKKNLVCLLSAEHLYKLEESNV